jgi:hypothetical protein
LRADVVDLVARAVVFFALELAREVAFLALAERALVERPVLLERELVDALPVLFDREVRVLRPLEPPLERDPDPPLLACGI